MTNSPSSGAEPRSSRFRIQRRHLPHLIAATLGALLVGVLLYRPPLSDSNHTLKSDHRGDNPRRRGVREPGGTGHRYKVITSSLTWSQAKKRCEDLGGHLATITSNQEDEYIKRLLPTAKKEELHFWIGLTDDGREGRWKWITGEVSKHSSWGDGEPNNYGGNEDYATIASSPKGAHHGRWNDFDGPNRVHKIIVGFVCEWEDESTTSTTPTGVATFQAHRYEFFRDKLTWFWAQKRCEDMGGYLATISSVEENDFVASLLPRERDYETYFWIGLTDASNERSWVWIDGEALTYHKWRLGEPNDAGEKEDYVAITSSPKTPEHGTWIDLEGPHKTHDIVVGFVCEWDGELPKARNAQGGVPSPSDLNRSVAQVFFNGHRYTVFTQMTTWSQANFQCEQMGGHLLTIETKEEWNFVTSQALNFPLHETFYWIGLTDRSKEGEWMWIHGQKPAYPKWRRGEPNDFGGNEDYGSIVASPEKLLHGCWNDFEGPDRVHDMVVGFICEWEK